MLKILLLQKYVYKVNIYLKLSCNLEAFASERYRNIQIYYVFVRAYIIQEKIFKHLLKVILNPSATP